MSMTDEETGKLFRETQRLDKQVNDILAWLETQSKALSDASNLIGPVKLHRPYAIDSISFHSAEEMRGKLNNLKESRRLLRDVSNTLAGTR